MIGLKPNQRDVKMEKLITIREAAEIIGYSRIRIRDWIRAGELKSYRKDPRAQLRLKVSDLEKLMRSGSNLAKVNPVGRPPGKKGKG